MFMVQVARCIPPELKIPTQVLQDIIMVYEFGSLEKLGSDPNLICNREGGIWTTWTDVIALRDRIREIKESL